MINQEVITDDFTPILNWLSKNTSKKIFLVTGKKSFIHSGSEKYLSPILSKYPFVRFSDFSENPAIEDVYKGIELLKIGGCDCCIAIGGGSVIDMAKLISYLQNEKSNDPELIIKYKVPTVRRKIPLCVIPTTAGSGAESTHFAVVYVGKKKYSLSHNSILPDLVSLNANLSYSLSPYLKAITGLDALAQGIESFWSKKSTKQSREYSAEAIKLLWNNLKKSVLENDFEAHKKVVIGSNLAGKAINIAKTTTAHAFSYYFTIHHNLKHGHAVSLTLGKVYGFNKSRVQDSDEEMKQIFIELDKLLHIEGDSMLTIEQFISDLNIELDYSKLNIDIIKELPQIKKEVNIERLNNNPFKIELKDFENLLIIS